MDESFGIGWMVNPKGELLCTTLLFPGSLGTHSSASKSSKHNPPEDPES